MARGGVRFFNHFRDKPEGLEGVTGGGAWPVGAGWDLLGWREPLWFVGGVWGSKGQWSELKGLRE